MLLDPADVAGMNMIKRAMEMVFSSGVHKEVGAKEF